ncbi:MAG: peptidase M64 [Bacteroidales bacterium]|nr:peptidase M64 [Bacteroidales bacterium]
MTAVLALFAINACSSSSRHTYPKYDGTASSCYQGDSPLYDDYFTPERLRVDLVFAGNHRKSEVFLDGLYREREWSGSPMSLIDKTGMGSLFYEVFAVEPSGTDVIENDLEVQDGVTPTPPEEGSYNTLIFSRGFNTLFEEWTTTEESKRESMSMNQTIWLPMPKRSVKIVIYGRDKSTGMLDPMGEFTVNPADRHIVPPEAQKQSKLTNLIDNGPVTEKADIVFLAEGYTEDQMGKFLKDAGRFADYIFSIEPFASHRSDFNVWAVESASEESGVDIPQNGIWRHTAMESTFDTFYTDRYLTIFDHSKVADAASSAPFDVIVVIANCEKYGGGGIYNSYAMGTSDHPMSLGVIVHEFAHHFAGLADEYFNKSTGYDESFYPLNIEPWEPNITTKVDFSSKWEAIMGLDTGHGEVGLYEGGGYVAKGVFRPLEDCIMHHHTQSYFCPVCSKAIENMIDYYTKK